MYAWVCVYVWLLLPLLSLLPLFRRNFFFHHNPLWLLHSLLIKLHSREWVNFDKQVNSSNDGSERNRIGINVIFRKHRMPKMPNYQKCQGKYFTNWRKNFYFGINKRLNLINIIFIFFNYFINYLLLKYVFFLIIKLCNWVKIVISHN